MKPLDKEKIKLEYLTFTDHTKTIMLSTVNKYGQPFISYAPFVKKNGKLYIYISKIANHYYHIENHPAVDVMFIEDEMQCRNLFARQRARFACTAINLGNKGYEDIFDLFGQIFGESMIRMLQELDFSLFELTVHEGRYVVGFGQAFDIDLSGNRFDLVSRDGHMSEASI